MTTTQAPIQAEGLYTRFQQDGYVVARKVIDDSLVQECRNHIDWLLEKNPGKRPEQLHHTLMTDDPFWVRLVSDDRLLDIAEQFVGPNIALFASHYIAKRPYDGQAVLWHQDGSYWPLEPMEVVTLWLAIDDSTAENGCMRVIPGTQTQRIVTRAELKKRTDVDNVLGTSMDEALVDEARAVDLVLQAGDVSIHHPAIIHGSNANTSPRWRRGLTIRYIPTSTRILSNEPWPSAFLLRGDRVAGINQYQPMPMYQADKHMLFGGWEAWNAQCAVWNERV
jgi:ectoine hydroxylase-related dioxygenase (phytanoyl-CoA dioxygenase family)